MNKKIGVVVILLLIILISAIVKRGDIFLVGDKIGTIGLVLFLMIILQEGKLTAEKWNGSIGGILVFRAKE